MTAQSITQNRLKEILHYNQNTGVFTWTSNAPRNRMRSAGYKNNIGYIRIRCDGILYLAHRLAWLYVYGKLPKLDIDHIDKNPSNNKISNIREVKHSINMKNQKLYSQNVTGIHGVYLRDAGSWMVSISDSGKQVYGGTFIEYWDAICCRKSLEAKYNYHENHGRS